MRVVLVVAAALINANGRILIAQQPKGKATRGPVGISGGKVAPERGSEGALIRELNEELGKKAKRVKASCLSGH